MSDQDLPGRLRAMHAARVHHFTPTAHGGQPQAPAFSIVATEERLQDLLTAADMLEIHRGDAATLARALADEVRAAAQSELSGCGPDGHIAITSMCRRLGVTL